MPFHYNCKCRIPSTYLLILSEKPNHDVTEDDSTEKPTPSREKVLYFSLGIAGGIVVVVVIIAIVWCHRQGYMCGKRNKVRIKWDKNKLNIKIELL